MSSEETSFPLYDHIYESLKKRELLDQDISFEEVCEIVETVRTMDKTALECVFIIIRIHSLRNEDTKVFDMPYKGEKINKNMDIKFDIRTLPAELRRILLEFVRMHKKKNQDTTSIN